MSLAPLAWATDCEVHSTCRIGEIDRPVANQSADGGQMSIDQRHIIGRYCLTILGDPLLELLWTEYAVWESLDVNDLGELDER